MTPSLASVLSPALRRLDPERAHRFAILALRAGLAGAGRALDDDALAVTAAGRRFPNPIGIAAGFDKDAKALRGLVRLGFGFVEAGTVTLRPQPGNQRPRVFRLVEDEAVINRYGLNSEGYDAMQQRLDRLPRTGLRAAVGVNVGPNKGGDAERDLPPLITKLSATPGISYAAINVSSPNTPGLRHLQQGRRLASLLAAIKAACPRPLPLMVKIAPDQAPGALGEIIETCAAAGVAGLIVGNTTVARPATLRSPARGEVGGLSGRPLFEPSTQLLRDAHRLARGRLLLVGCGGVRTGADALAKIKAGASLVQLYTAFAYAGPAIVPRLKRELLEAMRAEGFARISDAIGAGA
jgi:dihydroorotate dehydrogenase